MNRETRKANLRKLKLPATSSGINQSSSPPRLRSRAANKTDEPCISDFFTAKQTTMPPNKLKRQNLSTFVGKKLQEPQQQQQQQQEAVKPPQRQSDDFETPAKQVKRAPKLKRSTTATKASTKSRQPKIKSAFLRNEEAFTAIAAQHCLADNFSPDDMQLALAMSRSEAERHGDTPSDGIVELIEEHGRKPIFNSQDSIRTKLQKYGFRTAAKEDYNSLAASLLPQRRVKTKWASKFTALTLRDPEQQRRKLLANIERFLAQQYCTAAPRPSVDVGAPGGCEQGAYSLCSHTLRRSRPAPHSHCIRKEFHALEDYFVGELFEVSRVNAGHLLKDWSVIQGRDMTPSRKGAHHRGRQMELQRVYAELERCFGQAVAPTVDIGEVTASQSAPQEVAVVMPEIGELSVDIKTVELLAKQCSEEETSFEVASSRAAVQCSSPNSLEVKSPESQTTALAATKSSFSSQAPSAARSPDVFADSDEDMETGGEAKPDDNTADGIKSFEIFSSNEDVSAVDEAEALGNVAIIEIEEESNEAIEAPVVSAENDVPEAIVLLESTAAVDAANHMEPVIDLTQGYLHVHGIAPASSATSQFSHCTDDFIEVMDFCGKRPSLVGRHSLNKSMSSPTLGGHSFGKPKNNSFTQSQCKPQSPTCQGKSFTEHLSEASIDLTQNDDDADADEGLMLSDDEINYSIWKSDKARKSIQPTHTDNDTVLTISSDSDDTDTNPNDISVLDLIDGEVVGTPPKPASMVGAAESSPLLQTPPQQSAAEMLADASFSATPSARAAEFMKQCSHSLSTKKYSNLVTEIGRQSDDDADIDEFDEFDRLVYGSPIPKQQQEKQQSKSQPAPFGLDQLLTSEIRLDCHTMHRTAATAPTKPPPPPKQMTTAAPPMAVPKANSGVDVYPVEEIRINNHLYRTRLTRSPKPDFAKMSETELLQRLCDYGIKPLQRKHAVKLLEYIYNRTHPIVLNADDRQGGGGAATQQKQRPNEGRVGQANATAKEPAQFQLQDNCVHNLLRFGGDLNAELPTEPYILQTNITKKTAQPLVPLHVAWFNLVCANPALHEAILKYVPIDLQEIHLYLKSLGYRYEPKDMKTFCDRRCIIFRYDMNGTAGERKRRGPTKKKSAAVSKASK